MRIVRESGGMRSSYLMPRNGGRDMTRDKLIREARNNGASWPALVLVYGVLLGTLFLTANAII